uniref:Reverse transcriptase n=1 Tax=Timema cristinae TaxID=61476 RepID=A0A7R9D799_TIMCR|nr:unnamed protein product [Timema cristinae]
MEDYVGVDVSLFNREEINDAVQSCRNKKAPYLDLLMIIQEDHFLDSWKAGKLRILMKSPDRDPTDPKSYWHLTLLNVLIKVMKKMLASRLGEYIQIYGVLDDRQYGFRPGIGTVDALERVLRDRPGIVEKLRITGCPKNLYEVVRDYFRNRTTRLFLKHMESVKVNTRKAGRQGGERHGDGDRVENGGPAYVFEGEDKDDPPQGNHSAMRHPMSGSRSGEVCVWEAHPSLKNFLRIGLLDSTEDVQGPSGVKWDESTKGRETYQYLPSVQESMESNWVVTNPYATQLFTGHGNFNARLHGFGLKENPDCEACGAHEEVEYVLLTCEWFEKERRILSLDLGELLSKTTMMRDARSCACFLRRVEVATSTRSPLGNVE